MVRRIGIGRQRVVIERIRNTSNLQVTFSKRWLGVFNKANELCTLCGAQTAIIIFSPGGKVYSFGHPCLESVVERFITQNPTSNGHELTHRIVEAHQRDNQHNLNFQLTQFGTLLQAEKRCRQTIDEARSESERQYWWERPIEELDLQQLEQLKAALEDVKNNVNQKADIIEKETKVPSLMSQLPSRSFNGRRYGNVSIGEYWPIPPSCNNIVSFNSTSNSLFDARSNESNNVVPFDPFMTLGSFNKVSFDPNVVGYSNKVTFNPMSLGFVREVVPSHPMVDRAPRSNGGVLFDSSAPETSKERPLDHMTPERGVPVDVGATRSNGFMTSHGLDQSFGHFSEK